MEYLNKTEKPLNSAENNSTNSVMVSGVINFMKFRFSFHLIKKRTVIDAGAYMYIPVRSESLNYTIYVYLLFIKAIK